MRRIKKMPAPVDIYQESDMIIRTIRDIFTSDVDTIYIDEPTAYERAKEFLQIVMPRYANRLQALRRQGAAVPQVRPRRGDRQDPAAARCRCRHGGSIVIDQTEALVAIDVNSGNFRADDNAEETAYQMNLQAAKEIARQLRLRDLGGVIVNDFIDMRKEKHRRGVERALRDAVRRDRARTKILRTSPFGLIEMTRQRIRAEPEAERLQGLPGCHGTAVVKTSESMAIEVVRLLIVIAQKPAIVQVRVTRGRRRGRLPEQPQAARPGPAGRRRQHDGADRRRRACRSRAPRFRVLGRRGPGSEVPLDGIVR